MGSHWISKDVAARWSCSRGVAPSWQVSTCASAVKHHTHLHLAALPSCLGARCPHAHTHLNVTARSSVGSAVFPRRDKMLCFSSNSPFSRCSGFALLRACCGPDKAVGSMGSSCWVLVAQTGLQLPKPASGRWGECSHLTWGPYVWFKAEFGA